MAEPGAPGGIDELERIIEALGDLGPVLKRWMSEDHVAPGGPGQTPAELDERREERERNQATADAAAPATEEGEATATRIRELEAGDSSDITDADREAAAESPEMQAVFDMLLQKDVVLESIVGSVLTVGTEGLDYGILYDELWNQGGDIAKALHQSQMESGETVAEFEKRVVIAQLVGQGLTAGNKAALEQYGIRQNVMGRRTMVESASGPIYSDEIDLVESRGAELAGFGANIIGLARNAGIDPLAAADAYIIGVREGTINGFERAHWAGGTAPRSAVVGGTGADSADYGNILTKPVGDLLTAYEEGLTLYNRDPIFGMIHAMDPALAARVAEFNYRPSRDETIQIQNIITDISPDVEGYLPSTLDYFAGLAAGAGGGGVIAHQGDEREAVRTLAQAWNLGPMSDDQLNTVVSSFLEERIAAANEAAFHPLKPVSTESGASVIEGPSREEALRMTAQYKGLYGNKSEGENEIDYANRFTNATTRFLGDIGDNMEFEQAGMRTGDVQTSIGQATVSQEAQGSSVFLNRMARAAKIVQGMT